MNDFNGGLYSGTLYADFFVDGVSTGLKEAGNATAFELKPNADKKILPSNKKGTFGQALKTAVIPKPSELKIVVNDPVREVFLIGFMGTGQTIADVSGTVTDEEHPAPEAGNKIDLDFRDISTVVVTKADLSVAVLNTDYEIGVNGSRLGWITILPGSSITKGEILKIDYAYGARNGYLIKGATQPIAKVRWFLDGENFADGRPVLVDVFESDAMPSSPIDFLSSDWQKIEIMATPLTPSGKDHPYSIEFPGS